MPALSRQRVKTRSGRMHVDQAGRHYTTADGERRSYPTYLLHRSYRDEQGRPRKETLANLTGLPPESIEALRATLRGRILADAQAAFEAQRSVPHGDVAAAHVMASALGLRALLGPACAERDLAYALVLSRAVRPRPKLATVRWWAGGDTTLGADLAVAGAGTDEIYAAMDWLTARQGEIELAARHLREGGIAMFDLSSSWVEGSCCELAAFGHSRDAKRGRRQVEYALLTDAGGRPVAVEVFAGKGGALSPRHTVITADDARMRASAAFRAVFRGAAGLRKCSKDVLVRPFLAQDPREHVVGTAHAVRRVLRVLHCQGDRGRQQSPRRNRVGKRAVQPQILVLRLPPHAESALQITGTNPDPHPVGHRVPARQPDRKQRAHERAHPGDLHHHRHLRALVAEPCTGHTFLSRAIENRFGEAEPDLPVVGIDRASAHPAPLLGHIPTLPHRMPGRRTHLPRMERPHPKALGQLNSPLRAGAQRPGRRSASHSGPSTAANTGSAAGRVLAIRCSSLTCPGSAMPPASGAVRRRAWSWPPRPHRDRSRWFPRARQQQILSRWASA